jgi:hypothetical protein
MIVFSLFACTFSQPYLPFLRGMKEMIIRWIISDLNPAMSSLLFQSSRYPNSSIMQWVDRLERGHQRHLDEAKYDANAVHPPAPTKHPIQCQQHHLPFTGTELKFTAISQQAMEDFHGRSNHQIVSSSSKLSCLRDHGLHGQCLRPAFHEMTITS